MPVRKPGRLMALAAVVVFLSACGKDHRSAAPSNGSSGASSPASAFASVPASSATTSDSSNTAPSPSATTLPPPPTSLRPAVKPDAPPPPSAVCQQLTSDNFSQALGVAFTLSGKTSDTHCPYDGGDGSHVTLFIEQTSGSADQALQQHEGGCDAGTVQPIDVGEGGFTCMSGGLPMAAAVGNGSVYQLNALVLVTVSNDQALQGFPTLLGKLA